YFTWEASTEATNNGQLLFFPVSFEFEAWPTSVASGKVRFSLQRCFSCMERFALKLSAVQQGQCIRLELHYDPAHFSPQQMESLSNCLYTLLHSAVSQPQASVGTLELLPYSEQQRLLQMAFQARTEYPGQP